MSETWLAVPGYEGSYEVSDLGRVRSLDRLVPMPYNPYLRRGRVLKPIPTQSGHLTVGLYLNATGPRMRTIHRLVMEAFVGPCPSGLEVRHLDGDPANNHISNLAYGTHSENVKDSVRHGTHPSASRTHCIHGHEFDNENTHRDSTGRRICRACGRRKSREHYARQRKAEVSA